MFLKPILEMIRHSVPNEGFFEGISIIPYSHTLKCRIFAYIQRHIGNAICYWAFYAKHILYISYLGTWKYKFNKITLLRNFSPMIEMVYVVGQIKTISRSMFSSLHPFISENVGSLRTLQTHFGNTTTY
mgnify:CR=1 FL=1